MTSRNRKWYRWPENYRPGWGPWFVVLRRIAFFPVLIVALGLLFIAFWGAYGFRDARRICGSVI